MPTPLSRIPYSTCFLLSFPSKVLHPIVSHQHSIQYSFRGYNCPHLPHTKRIFYSHLVCCPLFLNAVCNLHSLGQRMCSNYLSPRPQITNKNSPEPWWNHAECAGFLLASFGPHPPLLAHGTDKSQVSNRVSTWIHSWRMLKNSPVPKNWKT
jgi:hypothetical protein